MKIGHNSELDLMVAEEMGWKIKNNTWGVDPNGIVSSIPCYSTNLDDAKELANIAHISLISSVDGWYAVVTEDVIHHDKVSKEVRGKFWALSDNPAEAIARAYLNWKANE